MRQRSIRYQHALASNSLSFSFSLPLPHAQLFSFVLYTCKTSSCRDSRLSKSRSRFKKKVKCKRRYFWTAKKISCSEEKRRHDSPKKWETEERVKRAFSTPSATRTATANAYTFFSLAPTHRKCNVHYKSKKKLYFEDPHIYIACMHMNSHIFMYKYVYTEANIRLQKKNVCRFVSAVVRRGFRAVQAHFSVLSRWRVPEDHNL